MRGTARPSSDLDLCILSEKPLGFTLLGQVRDDFSGSTLPFRVDVVEWATVAEGVRGSIERDGVMVQEGNKENRNIVKKWDIV